MDSPVCLRLHWIKALPVFSRIHELRCPIASVTGLAQVSFDGLRATDVLASLMAWTRQYAFACTGSRQCLLSVASMSYASRAREAMNPARHRFVALHDLEELVRMKARHAEVRLLAHGAVDTRNYSKSVRHVLRQSCARTRLRAALRLKVLCNLYSLAYFVAIDSLLHLRWSQNLCSFAFMSCNNRSRV